MLQADLDNIVNWSATWKLFFNHSKTVKLTFGSKGHHSSTSYYLENVVVSEKKTHKDLGVMFSSTLSWNYHYDNLAQNAYTMLSILRRSFSIHAPNKTKKLLYMYLSLIRSRLLYCSPVWRPHLYQA